MTRFGYTLLTEQSGPKDLVRYAVSAERRGFDFEVCSDHFSPWLTSQGHAPNAWTVLGAVAQATDRVDLYSYVTCPTVRYHPVIVAQQAATVQILSDGRFTLGLGSGENLNEHVVGHGWPTVQRRQDMLREAIEIIRALFDGGTVNWRGHYFQVDLARLWDLPEVPVGVAVAMAGEKGIANFTTLSDHLIAVQPDQDLVHGWHTARQAAGLAGSGRVVGQVPVCWIPTATPPCTAPMTSSAGSAVAGRSTRTCRPRPVSRPPPSSSGPRTSRTAFRADPTWMRSSTRCAPTGRPASPILR
ncbi:F420-dependent glucose-6-phosphate dehydrogenase 1 [Mycobacterium talmoniae]|uniref:F420-dependent glucose-6-phosphate dehydrogenase 1 n=1 Tax=Mycobacterium talmoniae TaxID=1858794 RepID=A0A2S8BFQ2_9MYCO|nr:F420-dependent glucose-6-phosphate dehydrogenase 1 [Mycobacterium talmoniae]